MEIAIQLTRAPISEPLPPPSGGGAGAWVEFRGIVRGEEDGQAISALEYEAYSPMAEAEMRRILEMLAVDRPCLAARVIHRVGVVPVGEAAIYVGIAGRHRSEAFALLGEFVTRLKQDVPIWKRRAIVVADLVENPTPSPPSDPGKGFPRPKTAHSAAEVLSLLASLCAPLPAERAPLADAAGRVLRETVCAPDDQPPFDRSAVDGFAVRLDDPSTRFRIVDDIRAGDWKPRVLQPGEAARIATGGALPGQNLQVLMRENARVEGAFLTALCRDGERNVRFRGEDARAGQKVVEAGSPLQPGALGLLASIGCVRPLVARLPRALHLATGNEIVSPERSPERGQIRDSNSTLTRAFLSPWGIVPEQRRVAEDAAWVKSALEPLEPALDKVDLLLISGGASVGEHDFTGRLLEELGFTIHVRRTTARPGKPLIVAQRGGALAFGLPGNPLAHFVCLNLYVRAALEAWAGQGAPSMFHTGVTAADLVTGGHAEETFWPAHWRLVNGAVALTPLRWSSSGDQTPLATANALIRVNAGFQRLARGSRVEFVSTERPS